MEDSDGVSTGAVSVRVLIVQILFSVAVCAGDVWDKRNEQLMADRMQYFIDRFYLQILCTVIGRMSAACFAY